MYAEPVEPENGKQLHTTVREPARLRNPRVAAAVERLSFPLPGRDRKTKEPKPLDEGVVRMHLNGDITISLYAINQETQRSKWVAIDADFDGALESLFQLQWELKQDGVDAALEQSRRGGHLWIFGAEPLLASECRIYV